MAQDLYQAAGLDPAQSQYQVPIDLYAAMGGTQLSAAPPNGTNIFDDFAHQLPGMDKLDAAAQATGIPLVPKGVPGDSWADRYHKDLTNIRANYGDFETVHPEQAYGAKAAGVIAPMLMMGPESVAGDVTNEAPTMAKAAIKSAKTGAATGSLYGFGGTDDSSLRQDLEATGLGTLAGGGIGVSFPLMMGIAQTPFRLAGKAAAPFTQGGVERTSGRVLSDAASGDDLNFESAPLPGMKLTAGQSSNDPGLLWLERSVAQGSPRGAELTANATAANNSTIREAISDLSPGLSADPNQAMAAALDKIQARRASDNSALWNAADVSNTGGMSGFQFNNYMKKYISGLPVADQDAIPASVTGLMDKIGQAKTQNLGDVQAVRSRILGLARAQQGQGGDANVARILGGLADQVDSFIDMKAANLGDTLPAYKTARADTRDMKQTFSTQPAARKFFGTDSYGADRLPVSGTVDNFLHAGTGGPEDLNSYLDMISTKDPKTGAITYDPDGLKAAQDAFAQKFLSTVSNAGVDSNGARLVSPAKMQKFLDDYSHVINSPLFTQPQRDMVASIARATQMASRTATSRPPGGGSDTFPKLQGDKFVDALIGPGAGKLLNTIGTAGGAVAGYMHEGLGAAAVGAFGGEKLSGLLGSLYSAPRDKVVNLITEAMHDPQLAQALMTKSSNTNAKLIPVTTRAKMLGLLGGRAAQPAVQALTAQ